MILAPAAPDSARRREQEPSKYTADFGSSDSTEADELMANVKGQGDPVGLVDARGDTYEDFVHALVSTPSRGLKGTRYHWTCAVRTGASASCRDLPASDTGARAKSLIRARTRRAKAPSSPVRATAASLQMRARPT